MRGEETRGGGEVRGNDVQPRRGHVRRDEICTAGGRGEGGEGSHEGERQEKKGELGMGRENKEARGRKGNREGGRKDEGRGGA